MGPSKHVRTLAPRSSPREAMANSIIKDMREGERGATLGLAARGCGGVEGAEVGEEAAAPTYGRGGYTSKGLRKSSTRRRAIGA